MKNEYEIRGEVTAIFIVRRDGTVVETIIDTADLEKVKQFPGAWHVCFSGSLYVLGNADKLNGKRKKINLHRLLMDANDGYVIDHINHDTLDNRRSNLREISLAQNNQNKSGANRRSKSGIRGVRFVPKKKKWEASVRRKNNALFQKFFNTPEEAERAVIEARKKFLPYSHEALS